MSSFSEFYPFFHDHEFSDLFLLPCGAVKHIVNGQSFVLNKGTLLLVRPRDQHGFKQFEDKDCQAINLAVLRSTLHNLWQFLGESFDTQKITEPEPPVSVQLSPFELLDLKNKLDVLNNIPRHQREKLRAELCILLVEVFVRYFWRMQKRAPAMSFRLEYVYREMEKPDKFKTGFPKLLEIAHKTQETVCLDFKTHIKRTPTRFINDLRLDYATNQLARSDQPVTTIAYDSGFLDLSHFHHLFKKKFLQTPRSYRTRHSKYMTPDKPSMTKNFQNIASLHKICPLYDHERPGR